MKSNRRCAVNRKRKKCTKRHKGGSKSKPIEHPKTFTIHKILFLTDGRIGGSYKFINTKISGNGNVNDLRIHIKNLLDKKHDLRRLFTATELSSKMILYAPEIMRGDDRNFLREILEDSQQLDQIAPNVYIRFIDMAHDATNPMNPIFVEPEHQLPPGWIETMEQRPPFRSIYTGESGVKTFRRPINADGFPLRFPFPGTDGGVQNMYQYVDPQTRRYYFHNPTTDTTTYNQPPEDIGRGWWRIYHDHGRVDNPGPLPTFYHNPELRRNRPDTPF